MGGRSNWKKGKTTPHWTPTVVSLWQNLGGTSDKSIFFCFLFFQVRRTNLSNIRHCNLEGPYVLPKVVRGWGKSFQFPESFHKLNTDIERDWRLVTTQKRNLVNPPRVPSSYGLSSSLPRFDSSNVVNFASPVVLLSSYMLLPKQLSKPKNFRDEVFILPKVPQNKFLSSSFNLFLHCTESTLLGVSVPDVDYVENSSRNPCLCDPILYETYVNK